MKFIQTPIADVILIEPQLFGDARGFFKPSTRRASWYGVSAGAVFDAVVDLRRASPTFGRSWGTELSDQNHRMLWVPPGLAHGILVMSETADFLYKCTDIYSPTHERTLAWNDPTPAIQWPIPRGVVPKLSVKDMAGRNIADIEKFA